MRGIDKDILRLAIPAVASNITVPLLGLSDTFITGHLGSDRYLAAIAVATTMTNTLFWLCGFLRMATSGLSANAFGAKNEAASALVLTRALILSLSISLIMIGCAAFIGEGMLSIMNPPQTVVSPAKSYFFVMMLASPAILSTMSLTGWMIGRQNTLYPMIVAISVNILNILLSLSFVYYLDVGFMGVAYGTLTANWVGLPIALLLARRLKRNSAMFSPLAMIFRGGGLKKFFRVSTDLFIRSGCMICVTFAMTSFGAQLGENVLAVNAIMMQFFLFFSYFMDGFAYAGEALCGRFSGAADISSLRSSISHLIFWSVALALLFFLIYRFFYLDITNILTDSSRIAQGIESIHWIVWILPPISVGAFMFDGIYIGLTATRRMLFSTLLGATIFFATYLGYPFLSVIPSGNFLLWSAFLMFLLMRCTVLASFLPYELKSISTSIPHHDKDC